MSKLVIVESPTKARTINRYLGPDYRVEASMGHVRDLPEKRMGVDVEADFRPEYVLLPTRAKALAKLRAAAKDADEVFLATDLDREGEAIAWHLVEALRLNPERTRRVVFNEITREAIREAFSAPRTLDMDKVNAQQARRILDRIVGYQISPLLWRRIAGSRSAGRVQSVAVRLVVEREREIRSFKPEEYWKITATVAPHERSTEAFKAVLKKLDGQDPAIRNEDQAKALVAELSGGEYRVARCAGSQTATKPPPPFITSTLQQQASTQLSMNPKRTMRAAQELYEGVEVGPEGAVGLITYMRTDSLRVSDQAVAECRAHIQGALGADYLPDAPNVFRSGKNSQGAHEAIRPTSVARTPEQVRQFLDADLFRVYQLIWNRFVASQMRPALWDVTDIEIVAGRGLFGAQGKRLAFDGFLRVAGIDPKAETRVPALEQGQALNLVELAPTQHFTKPPPRYNEASLVRALEKSGIGRPSTYAPIISLIQERGYVRQEKRHLFAEPLGETVTDQLIKHFPDIMSVEFTSSMEQELDQIEEQHRDWVGVLWDFYRPFRADFEKARKEMAMPETTDEKCPRCGAALVKRVGRRGPFLGCSTYPKCDYTRDAAPAVEGQAPPTEVNETCPQCGKPLAVRQGRRGPFMGCTGYPACKYLRDMAPPAEAAQEAIKDPCPDCGKPLAVRQGRRGPFVGCTGYPGCKYTRDLTPAPEAPPDAVCDKCGKPMAVRRGSRGLFLGCTGYPECRSTRPMPKTRSGEGQGE